MDIFENLDEFTLTALCLYSFSIRPVCARYVSPVNMAALVLSALPTLHPNSRCRFKFLRITPNSQWRTWYF